MATILSDTDVPAFKEFLKPLLQGIGDDAVTNSEILSDYVCTLLTTQPSPVEELKTTLTDQLDDFLQGHTTQFVQDVFQGIAEGRHLGPVTLPQANDSQIAGTSNPTGLPPNVPTGPANSHTPRNRKRGFNEHEGPQNGLDPHYGRNFSGDRSKQARRGGRGGLGMNGQIARATPSMPLPHSALGLPAFGSMPMPMPPVNFAFPPVASFDPNDPASALLALQAMGMPLPQMFGVAGSPSPIGIPASSFAQAHPDPRSFKPCRIFAKNGACTREKCPYNHDRTQVPPEVVIPPDQMMVVDEEYDPNTPTVGQPLLPNLQGLPGDDSRVARRSGTGRGRGRGRGHQHDGQRRGGRMDFSSTRPLTDRTKTTICVEKIPEEHLTESSLHEAFGDFGEITSVEMQESRQLALVKYAAWESAKSAFDSPKVLFDNRFVKVYWYDPDRERQFRQRHDSGTLASGGGEEEINGDAMEVDMEEVERKTAEAQKVYEEKQAKKRDTEAQMKELEAKREALLKSQAEERKKLLEKLAAKQQTRKESSEATNGDTQPSELSPEEERKRAQTEALRAQVAALESEASALGLSTDSQAHQAEYTGYEFSGRGRGGRGRGPYGYRGARGSYRGRGTLGAPAVKRADFRPRKLCITGPTGLDAEPWTTQKDEAMKQWLMTSLSEDIESVEDAADAHGLVVSFKERWMAEKCAGMIAGVGGTVDGVGRVDVKWVQAGQLNGHATNGAQSGHLQQQAIEGIPGAYGGGRTDAKAAEMDLDRAMDD